MRSSSVRRVAGLLWTSSLAAGIGLSAPAGAQSSPAAITLPAMPMAEALRTIAARTGTTIAIDPDAVRGKSSNPVRGAANAEEAAQAATAGTGVTVAPNPNGGLMVVNDIVVTARRDEAETSVLVRQTSSSSRLGQSLRDQPRNTQVISSKLMAEQQVQTVGDALRNAGGVSVNASNVQGGTTYSVRGFGSGGLGNGLPGSSSGSAGIGAGATQSVANIERIEVLKGPDALLAGTDNLGGTINIVTKKPGADPYLYVTTETGSFGHVRGTIDATNAINDAKTLSARVIATVSDDDHNFGGYRGNEDYLFAPSIRFKDARTDVILSIAASNQIFGLSPYTLVDPTTNRPQERPRDEPIVSPDQYVQIVSTQYYGEATRRIGDWLTLVARGQHQDTTLNLNNYSSLAVLAPNLLLVTTGAGQQKGQADAVDGFARVDVTTGPVTHKLVAGYTWARNQYASYSASGLSFLPYDLTGTSSPPALAPVDSHDYDLAATQKGVYGQYLAQWWKLHLIAGVRHNGYDSALTFPGGTPSRDEASKTLPNFGAIVDVTDDLRLFGSLVYGYSPNFILDRNQNKLPDNQTRNIEAGVKIDLLRDRMFFTGSWFRLRQSNVVVADPTDYRYSIALPGQLGTGFDVNLSGEIVRGWTLQAGYTRTEYRYLDDSLGNHVAGQPRDQYNVYTSYRRSFGDDVKAGLGVGVYGRSSAAASVYDSVFSPAALQVDTNAFLSVGRLDVNLGIRNLFDRENYGITYTSSYIPYGEPRTWRLTVGYRFQ